MSPLRGSQGVALDLWDFTVLKAFMWPLALSQDWGFCPQPFICPSLKKEREACLHPQMTYVCQTLGVQSPSDLVLAQDLALETDTTPQLHRNGKRCVFKHILSLSNYQGCHICWKGFLFCFDFLISVPFYLLFQKLSSHILGREFLYPDSTPSTFLFYLSHLSYAQFFFSRV